MFVKAFAKRDVVPYEALECVLLGALKIGKSAVLLLLDELLKATDPTAVRRLICACLDLFPDTQFNLVITTLDSLIVQAETTDSGRDVLWVPLTAASLKDALTLFAPDSAALLHNEQPSAKFWCAVRPCNKPCTN
eukprot:TRINITY_DN6763_c1_g2_i1.p1 TRINITY_DN6763_c1_g2~~TRINITY_DN6763_c1_g2_i1.p1  ORF type:complete len:135 (+),score=16.58 TRINITY_DN6763_c1_g2_i1:315-719(+)